MHALFKTLALSLLLLSLAARTAFGIAGFSSVASQGKPVKEEPGWPAKIIDLINDPVRTVGWNFWFSECPNDVNHYAFAAKDTADVNRLIKVLSAAKAKGATVALALGKEFPAGGFSFLKPGNNIPAVLAFGNQVELNRWFTHLEIIEPGVRKWGVNRLTEVPTALPPTLTIYIEHPAVNLDKLQLGADLNVVAYITADERSKRKDDPMIQAVDRLLQRRQRASELR